MIKGEESVMNESHQPGTLASLIPEAARARKSSKGLWIGLGIGAVMLCCIATLIIGLIERNQILALVKQVSSTPLSLGAPALNTENAIWQVKINSVQTSAETLRDAQGSTAVPSSGYIYLVVKTTLVNKSPDSQTLMIGLGVGDAVVTDDKGKSYPLSAVARNSSVTLDMPSTISMLYIYPDAPDGEATDFYFSIPVGTKVVSFKYKDLPSLTPLPTP
jgi:hypothetical protein